MMLGLLRTALLLSPVLASVATKPTSDDVGKTFFTSEDFTITTQNHAVNDLIQSSLIAEIKVPLPDIISTQLKLPVLLFAVEVLSSEQECKYENVTVNGRELALDGSDHWPSGLSGNSPLMLDGTPVEAKWFFRCVGQPGHQFQLFNLIITRVNDVAIPDDYEFGFGLQYTQRGMPNVQSVNVQTEGHHSPFNVKPVDDEPVFAEPIFHEELPEDYEEEYSDDRLEFELAELGDLVSQLRALEHMIEEQREAIARYSPEFIYGIRACDNVKCILKAVHHKIRCGLRKIYKKFHGRHHHHGHDKHGKHGNHTCGHKPGKGNHTHPRPPHWRRPHHGIPICRFPPPHHWPPHRDPHGKPPQHPEPPYAKRPGHGPPHNGQPPFDDQDHFAFFDVGQPDVPAHRRPGKQEEGQIQSFRSSSPARPKGGPHPPPPPPPPPPPHHFQGHWHPGLHRALHLLKYIGTGIVIACLAFALHRRAFTASRRAERRARREERRRRRAFCRARRHQAFRRFIARLTGRPFDEALITDDYEEKRAALLANAENGLSDTMSEEIVQFRNAASVVGDIVAVESQFPPRVDSRLMMAHEIGSQVGEGEELPAYEDEEGSEISSVADGLRYTPGSTEYDPAQSREGSLSDILGPDVKN